MRGSYGGIFGPERRAIATGLVAGAGVEVHVGQGATSWDGDVDERLDGEMDHLLKLVKMQVGQLRPCAASTIRVRVRCTSTIRTYVGEPELSF
jgi:hypothetical protein